jgi:flagellin-like hook-associated protein FlgL
MKGDSMSEDLTKKVLATDSEKINLILTIVKKLESHETLLTQIIDALGSHGAILTQILDRLDKLTYRVDAVETRLGIVESRFDAIDVRLQGLEQTMKRSVHNLDRGQSVLNDAILKIHVGFLDIDERLQGLEPRTSPAKSST